jgi:hypothetical protein
MLLDAFLSFLCIWQNTPEAFLHNFFNAFVQMAVIQAFKLVKRFCSPTHPLLAVTVFINHNGRNM